LGEGFCPDIAFFLDLRCRQFEACAAGTRGSKHLGVPHTYRDPGPLEVHNLKYCSAGAPLTAGVFGNEIYAPAQDYLPVGIADRIREAGGILGAGVPGNPFNRIATVICGYCIPIPVYPGAEERVHSQIGGALHDQIGRLATENRRLVVADPDLL
jgi:hypothetical protein